MEDQSIIKLALLHPAIRYDAVNAYNEAVKATPIGVHPIITFTLRTFDEQAALYAQGRTTPGQKVTNAKPGQSCHNYALALDFALQIDGKLSWVVDENWMIVVNCFKVKGFDWGGDWKTFKDSPHLQKTNGLTWKQLLVMHDQNNFITGTDYININNENIILS